jgi:hypothetical protein
MGVQEDGVVGGGAEVVSGETDGFEIFAVLNHEKL